MKQGLWLIGFIFLFVFNASKIFGQCTNCNEQWPAGTSSTTSPTLSTVSTCMYGGDYAVFNVTAGETYTWTTCGNTAFDTQLTLYGGGAPGCQGVSLAYNDDACGLQSTITWTATLTGTVNVLVSQWSCLSNGTCMTLQWACTSCASAPITGCSGTLYDTGGPGGNYTNSENYTVTYCPATAGECIQAAFSSFATESCCDYIRIYDGPTIGSPLIGQYQGTNNPGIVLGSIANASGCLTFEFYSDGSVTSTGWAASITCETCGPDPNAPIVTCSDTFYDTGGPGGNYSNSENYTVTYCPATAGECIQAAFSSFNTESCCDYMRIYDGPTTGSPLIGQFQGVVGPGAIVGSLANASGCLTFEFFSDGSITSSGWSANISCDECGVTPPPPPAPPQDCNGGITICSDETFSGNSSGFGIQDLNAANQGCIIDGEDQSTWFFFSPQSTGTIAFMINPTPIVDYDFAIWGPYNEPICPPPGPPLRCSWSAALVPTGLSAGAGDNTEGAGGDAVVNPITVGPAQVGQVYILLIDNYSSTTTPYDFNWNLGGGLILDCTVLPVELLELTGARVGDHNILRWKTATETNADYFEIERSTDGVNYSPIGSTPAAGFSSIPQSYVYQDKNVGAQRYYYRLKQVDFDGAFEYLGPVAIDGLVSSTHFGQPYPNPSESGRYQIEVNVPQDRILQSTILDATGRPLMKHAHPVTKGYQTLQIDASSLASGVYQLQFADHLGQVMHTTGLIK